MAAWIALNRVSHCLNRPTATSIGGIDFVFDQLTAGGRFRSLTIIDTFTKECPAIEVAKSLPASRVVQTLNRLSLFHGLPEAIVLDNGPEMISYALDQWPYENGVKLIFIAPGKSCQNGFTDTSVHASRGT